MDGKELIFQKENILGESLQNNWKRYFKGLIYGMK
jgi:hypothetical protein